MRPVGGDAHIAPDVELTPDGEIVERDLRSTPGMEKLVIMPDHVHALITIPGKPVEAAGGSSGPMRASALRQRGYCDHVIRDENDPLRCWKYMDENPEKWEERRNGC